MPGHAPLGHPFEDGEVPVEVSAAVLRAVADGRILGPFDFTAVGADFFNQAAQKGGFTRAVFADNGEPCAGLQNHLATAEQRAVVEPVSEILKHQRLAMQLLVLFEGDVGGDPAGRFDLVQLDLLHFLGAGAGLFRLGGVGRKAVHKALQLFQLRGLFRVAGLQLVLYQRGRGHEGFVVARVDAQLTVVDIRHVGTHRVQEVAIVGNDDHGALALVQHPGQPVDAVDVQVVGRFIQQQDVRVRKECLGEQYTQLPARRYLLHQTEVQGFLDARFQQQFASAALGGIAVHLRELDFQFGHAHAIVFAHFRQRVNALALLLHFPQCRVAHDDSVYHAVVFEGELVLTQYTQGAARFNRHVAGSGGECAT